MNRFKIEGPIKKPALHIVCFQLSRTGVKMWCHSMVLGRLQIMWKWSSYCHKILQNTWWSSSFCGVKNDSKERYHIWQTLLYFSNSQFNSNLIKGTQRQISVFPANTITKIEQNRSNGIVLGRSMRSVIHPPTSPMQIKENSYSVIYL